jgi:hypothetical protein
VGRIKHFDERFVMTAKFSAETHSERPDRLGGRRPPGPKGLPFLGYLLDFSRDVLGYYIEWSRQYGDISRRFRDVCV